MKLYKINNDIKDGNDINLLKIAIRRTAIINR